MRFLLDTNTCIYVIKQKPMQVLEKFQTIAPSDVGISSITLAELEFRASLEQQGIVVGALDLLIAAHALSLNLNLVTNNVREFSRISSLAVENWVV